LGADDPPRPPHHTARSIPARPATRRLAPRPPAHASVATEVRQTPPALTLPMATLDPPPPCALLPATRPTALHRLSPGAHKLPVSPPRPPSDHLHRYELLLPPEPPLRRRNWMMISGSEVGLSS